MLPLAATYALEIAGGVAAMTFATPLIITGCVAMGGVALYKTLNEQANMPRLEM